MATTVQKTVRYNFDEDIYFINNTYTRGKVIYNIAFGEYGGGSEKYNAYLIFRGVVIPKGATITNAYFEGCSDGYSSSATHVKISAEKNTTVSMPTTKAAYDALTTTAQVTWDITTEWNSLSWNSSPNIASCIQELVNLASWNSAGNDINLLIKDNNSTSGYRSFVSDSSLMPNLVITYTEEATPITLNASVSITCNNTINAITVNKNLCSVSINNSYNIIANAITDDITIGLYVDIEKLTYSELELLTYGEIQTLVGSIKLYCSATIASNITLICNAKKWISLVCAMTLTTSQSAFSICKKLSSSTINLTTVCNSTFILKNLLNIAISSNTTLGATSLVKLFKSTAINCSSNIIGILALRLTAASNMISNSVISAIAKTNLITNFIYKDIMLVMAAKANVSINKTLDTQTLINKIQNASVSVTERYNTIHSVTQEHKSEVEIFIDKEVNTKI